MSKTEKTRCTVVSRHHKVLQLHNFMIANKSLENMGITVTNKNFVHEEVKSRINSGNACYHSGLSLSSSLLLCKDLKRTRPRFYLLFSIGVKLVLSH
jgi:hypothetical protein